MMPRSFERQTARTSETATETRPGRGRAATLILVLAALVGLVAANGHFVYVAVTTQPDCVAHQKKPVAGSFRAAKSSC